MKARHIPHPEAHRQLRPPGLHVGVSDSTWQLPFVDALQRVVEFNQILLISLTIFLKSKSLIFFQILKFDAIIVF